MDAKLEKEGEQFAFPLTTNLIACDWHPRRPLVRGRFPNDGSYSYFPKSRTNVLPMCDTQNIVRPKSRVTMIGGKHCRCWCSYSHPFGTPPICLSTPSNRKALQHSDDRRRRRDHLLVVAARAIAKILYQRHCVLALLVGADTGMRLSQIQCS